MCGAQSQWKHEPIVQNYLSVAPSLETSKYRALCDCRNSPSQKDTAHSHLNHKESQKEWPVAVKNENSERLSNFIPIKKGCTVGTVLKPIKLLIFSTYKYSHVVWVTLIHGNCHAGPFSLGWITFEWADKKGEEPWLMWLSWLSLIPSTKRSPVWF